MGRLRLIYDESSRQMKEVGWWGTLNTEGCRKAMSGSLRYCLQDNVLYLPKDETAIAQRHRMCWSTVSSVELDEHPWLSDFDKEVPCDPLSLNLRFSSLTFGTRYSRRHQEMPDGRAAVSAFVAQSLIDKIAEDPDALLDVSKRDFESLVAELYARQGFDVDLMRGTKDGGIDLLAVWNESTTEPILFAVQTKHPNRANSKGSRTVLPVTDVREIYGVAKAKNLHGAVAITSNTYSPEAKEFTNLQPAEMDVADASTIHEWIAHYRWNSDE